MTLGQLIATVREWQSTMAPEQARAATEDWARGVTVTLGGLLVPATIDVDAVLEFARSGKPLAEYDTGRFLRWPTPPCKRKRHTKAARSPAPPVIVPVAPAPAAPEAAASPPAPSPPGAKDGTPKVAARARKLIRQQLANGPRPEAHIEAAAVPERTLIAAADELGVRTQRGQWWLPVS